MCPGERYIIKIQMYPRGYRFSDKEKHNQGLQCFIRTNGLFNITYCEASMPYCTHIVKHIL